MWIPEKQLLITQKGLDLPVSIRDLVINLSYRCLCSALSLLPDTIFSFQKKKERIPYTPLVKTNVERLFRIPICLKV